MRRKIFTVLLIVTASFLGACDIVGPVTSINIKISMPEEVTGEPEGNLHVCRFPAYVEVSGGRAGESMLEWTGGLALIKPLGRPDVQPQIVPLSRSALESALGRNLESGDRHDGELLIRTHTYPMEVEFQIKYFDVLKERTSTITKKSSCRN